MKPSRIIVFFLILISAFGARAQSGVESYPLNVTVSVMPRYPVRLSDYSDINSQVFIDIFNTTEEIYDVTLYGSLTGDNSVSIVTKDNAIYNTCLSIPIMPGANRLSGANLAELFDPANLKANNVTIDQIRSDEALPEGYYTLCVRAFDCVAKGTALSAEPDLMQGCFTFPSFYVQPPDISMYPCGEILTSDLSNITFNWLFVPPAEGYGEIRFKFRMIEIDPIGRNPNDAINTATEPYLVDKEVFTTSFNLDLNSDVTLEAGKSYAYQVIAYDPSGDVAFNNDGASEVCFFTYAVAAGTEAFAFQPTFPADGDYIPFDFFPFITKFAPYSDDYFLFTGDFTLKEKNGGSFRTIDSDASRNRWPDGPQIAQERLGFSGLTQEQSQHLPVYKNPGESHVTLTRGTTYRWDFNGSMEYSDGRNLDAATGDATFTIGMSPPSPEAPANGSTQAPGAIALSWTSAERPSRFAPPFDIAQYSGGSPINLFSSGVDEHWVLEVSPTTTFDSIYFTRNERTDGLVMNWVADSTALISALYTQIERDTTFTTAGTYYWRIKWLKTPGNLDSEAYSISPVWNFTIGTPPPGTTTPVAETPVDCVSECLTAEITNTTAVALSGTPTLRMGKFNLKVKSLTPNGTNKYNGEGEIIVSFLNNIIIKVAFEDIKANSDNEIFAGKAKAMDDLPHITADSVSTIVNGIAVSIPDFSESESDALEAVFETGERLVSIIGGTRPMGMPLGFDKEIDDYRFVIGITEMHFLPRKADITAVARVDVPALGEKLPAFGARGVCITPGGLGDEYALYLARDHEIVSAGDFKFVFNGNMTGDTTKASYIEFDCTGFKCVRLAGTVTIPGDKLVAENEDRTIDEDGHVTGNFAFKGCRGKNYMGSIGFSAFQISGMKGWGFKPITAYLDWSDLENPPGFEFPEGYEFGSEEEPRLANTWKGFYLKELSMHAPLEFDKKISGDVSVNVQNVIIDNSGFTGTVNIRNLIDYDDGELEGWAFSLDSIGFGVIQGTNISGGFKGKLGTPIFDEEDFLNYSAALTFVADTLKYNFRVFAKDTLGMDIWKARVTLNPDSQILFKGGTSVETELSMDLNGTVTIEGDLGVPQLSLPGIEFQALHLSTKDEFSIGHFGFTSPDKSAAGFPLNINDIGFSGGFTNPTVNFDLALTLSSAGFHAEVGLELIGKTYTDEKDRIKLRYDSTRLDAITINQKMDGGISIDGSLKFYNEDPVYGKGMKGNVAVGLPMDMAVAVTVQFGTVRTDLTAEYNSAGYFSYWYVDGSVRLPAKTVTLFPGFELRGFGGGAYHHMRLTTPPNTTVTAEEGETEKRSGAVYAPHYETILGLKASIVMAMSEEKTFNMDVGVQAEFVDYGLASLVVTGDGYIMAGFDERPDAKVTANIEIGYHNDGAGNKRVQGNFDVFVNVHPILKGSGADNLFVRAEFLADGDTWHFYMGKQPEDERSGLDLNVYLMRAEIRSYLMVGHGIPAGLPPLPQKVRDLLYGPQQASLEGAIQGGSLDREMPENQQNKLADGKGFAMGAHLHFGADMDFAIFYATLDLWAGFDINISQNAERVCYETGLHPGVNNWYATGQVYVALEGELGVQVNLWFIRGRFPIIELGAAVSLSGGVPKPVWMEGRAGLRYRILGGRIKGHCNFAIEAGEKCSYADPNPFSDIEFISGFSPDQGDEDISVFTAPRVSFALPVNELLELPAGLENEPELVRTFYPFVETSRTTLRDLDHNENVTGTYQRGAENVTGTFQPDGALEAQSRHKFEVVVRSREYFPNGTNALVKVRGAVWEEVKNVTFKSGDRPDVIVESQVAYTYPINKQAYFLKNETNRGKGLLKYLGSSQNYLFEEVDDNGNPYTFFARYIKLDDDSEARGEISLARDRLYFGVPSSLQNSSIYGVQIVRKNYEAPRTMQQEMAASVGNTNALNAPQAATIFQAYDLRDSQGGLAGTADVQMNTVRLLPAEIVRPTEKVLYSYYFRTSEFNSLQEKLGSTPLNAQYFYANGSLFEHVQLKGKMDEPFDEYEVNGYFKNGTKVLEPMLTFTDLQSNGYFRSTAQGYIYNLRNDLRRLNGRASTHRIGLTYRIDLRDFNSTRRGQSTLNIIPFKTIALSSSSDIGQPLADWELDKAAGINEYAPGASSTSGSVTASSSAGINLSSMVGNTNYSMGGLTAGVNTGSSNITARSSMMDFSGGGSSATQDFNLSFNTSMYVKLDAMEFQRQLSRWMATSHSILGGAFGLRVTNAEALLEDDPTLQRNITRLMTAPLSTFHYRNGNYQYRISYRYPGFTIAPGITKSFNINYHDQTVR